MKDYQCQIVLGNYLLLLVWFLILKICSVRIFQQEKLNLIVSIIASNNISEGTSNGKHVSQNCSQDKKFRWKIQN